MQSERRLYPRATVNRPARLRVADAEQWTEALLFDVSAGGAAVHVASPLSGRTDVKLRFSLPIPEQEDLQVEVNCLVVRSGTPKPSDPSRPHLYGLHFLDLHEAAFDGVRGWVWSRAHPEVG